MQYNKLYLCVKIFRFKYFKYSFAVDILEDILYSIFSQTEYFHTRESPDIVLPYHYKHNACRFAIPNVLEYKLFRSITLLHIQCQYIGNNNMKTILVFIAVVIF